MYRRLGFIILLAFGLSCSTVPDENEVVGGTFVGYTYSEQAVVDATVETEANYTLTFRAFDLGGDARFIVYIQRESTGSYYAGVIRLSIEDPHGNVYTHYHSTEGEAIDKPIIWPRRTPGLHHVSVEFLLSQDEYARTNFEVPLIREPVSGILIIGISLGILAAVASVVLLIRRRS